MLLPTTRVVIDVSSNENDEQRRARELELLLEAARRANWDALHGPPHLRSGRFDPYGPDAVPIAPTPPRPPADERQPDEPPETHDGSG
jgi:hypothetical protein